MARPIVLSNGRMHVGINDFGLVHDFYFPYVGLENHTIGPGLRHRIGLYIDGAFSWLDDGSWQFEFSLPHDALIGHTIARNSDLQIILEFDDSVDSELDAFMRNIHIINSADHERNIRLFMHQTFVIGDSRSNTDTVQYLPDSQAILHYRGRRVFTVSGQYNDQSFDQYAVGLFGIEGREGTWRDAEDGELSMSTVEHGRVDSVIRFPLQIDANGSARVSYWIAAGTSLRDSIATHRKIKEAGVYARLHQTSVYWHEWLKPVNAKLPEIPSEYRKLFVESALIIKAHIDKHGAIIASTDSSMLNYGRDAYAYCWPRDGAYVVWPLIRLGYTDEPLRYFDFARRGLHASGYLQHKYRADGALGSSWHSYVHPSGIVAPPIQEDETAITLFVFSRYYDMHKTTSLLDEYYDSFVKPMATFLSEYIDPDTHLPKPSYDLWEEQFITSTYTTAVTFAALLVAADLAEEAGDESSAVAWRSVAEDIYEAAHDKLYDRERQVFLKGLNYLSDKNTEPNTAMDSSSFFGAFMFGLFPADEPELTQAVTNFRNYYEQDKNIALPRYENDYYRQTIDGQSNYWHITSLWLAQYLLERGDETGAREIIDWVQRHASSTGTLSEQVTPDTNLSSSISPLVWSQAEFLATVLDLANGEK